MNYGTVKKEYKKKKGVYRRTVKYYSRNREFLFGHNSVLDIILGYLDNVISEADHVIKMIDEFDRDKGDKMATNIEFCRTIDFGNKIVESTTNLIKQTLSDIYEDDPMSLQRIRKEVGGEVPGIICGTTQIHAAIRNLSN